ncbi:hypothetical protein LVDJXP189_1460012 [Flavobacterium psychrophilum]|nr:hypothetical protein KU06062604_1240012 [Flavobacterium psychrophilum]SNB21347.1 hypothetical protein KU06112801_920009 [Flavobacterium psychrophilum]SNB37150.1 hypothetical protein NO098_340051 [Flavobacterium psychrophilum]SNB42377.1 hypothetical protein LVDJXP189_1460012 [Flavobacterium psychrophilum]SNB95337.1 hypothetical protein FPC840_1300005 [Flavobacterium psychrophilum]
MLAFFAFLAKQTAESPAQSRSKRGGWGTPKKIIVYICIKF